jgi:sigma-B regulation protein RsbU (phosphoserine phosphatase)
MTTHVPSLDLHAVEKLRAEELEEARYIQAEMLPTESLHAGPVTISHEFKPIAAVGGDFLDYFQLMDGTFGIYLCDVSGKGLPAALYAALSVGTLRGVHKTGTSPGDALATFNRRLLIRGMPRRHAAIQYAVFDPRSRDLHIASAGMPGPFHLCADGCRSLELSGIPPGLFADTRYETLTVRLSPGDSVLFLHRRDHRRIRPGRTTIRSRAFAGTVQQQAPSIARRTIDPHLFRGRRIFTRP